MVEKKNFMISFEEAQAKYPNITEDCYDNYLEFYKEQWGEGTLEDEIDIEYMAFVLQTNFGAIPYSATDFEDLAKILLTELSYDGDDPDRFGTVDFWNYYKLPSGRILINVVDLDFGNGEDIE